jgi:hypothetical protein
MRQAELGLPFHPENRGDIFIGKVGLSPNYTMLELQRLYSSFEYEFFIYA